MPGTWSTASPPAKPGPYANFVGAAAEAVADAVEGVEAVLGTSDWGPSDRPYEVTSPGGLTDLFGATTGQTLRRAVLAGLQGLDDGGAQRVLAQRVLGTGAVKATCVLNDGSAAAALTLTAKHAGTRPGAWTVSVQTNADDATKKDVILYESGIELERYSRQVNTNDAIAAAINAAASDYVTAAVTGAGARALGNVVGVAAGAGSFGTGSGGVAGTNGAAVTSVELAAALAVLQNYRFNAVLLAGGFESLQATFISWLRDLNNTLGNRCFGVIGGALAESLATALTRSQLYDDGASAPPFSLYDDVAKNVINVTQDWRRVVDGVVLPSNQVAEYIAGAVAGIGLKRSLVYEVASGYQVANPLTPAQSETAQGYGLIYFENDGVDRVRVMSQSTALLTTIESTQQTESKRPAVHRKIRNVGTDHFIQNRLRDLYSDRYIGALANTETGRKSIVGATLGFLEVLEEALILASGTSTVDLDERFVQVGSAVYLKLGITYQQTIERIFLSVRVK